MTCPSLALSAEAVEETEHGWVTGLISGEGEAIAPHDLVVWALANADALANGKVKYA